MKAECTKLRRQKELELEVMSGTIRDWEGEHISALGEIVHLGSVVVGPDRKDRYLVLFPSYLLILSVSARMSAFIYQGKLPLSGIAVNRLEDTDTVSNSFEVTGEDLHRVSYEKKFTHILTGPMIDRIVVICQSRQDSQKWLDHLQHQIKLSRQPGGASHPTPPPHVSQPPYADLTQWIRGAFDCGHLTRQKVGMWNRGRNYYEPVRQRRVGADALQRKAFKFTGDDDDCFDDFDDMFERLSSSPSVVATSSDGSNLPPQFRGRRLDSIAGDDLRFIDSTPSRETSVCRGSVPLCAPTKLDYDEIWKNFYASAEPEVERERPELQQAVDADVAEQKPTSANFPGKRAQLFSSINPTGQIAFFSPSGLSGHSAGRAVWR